MDADKQKALEDSGWKVGDAADFLEMTEEEREKLTTVVNPYPAYPTGEFKD